MPHSTQTRLLTTVALIAIVGAVVFIWKNKSQPQTSAQQSTPPSSIEPKLPLHPIVSQITDGAQHAPYLKLNYLIKELPTDLAQHDIDALLTLITSPAPKNFTNTEWGSLSNDLQEALTVQSTPNAVVARSLIATYRDTSRSQIMRDYALQHIGGFACYLIHSAGTRSHTLPAFFPSLIGALNAAAAETSKPWAGTALNLLTRIIAAADYRGMKIDGIDPQSLTRQAVAIATNPQAPLNARLPALQFASRYNAPEALAEARLILADPSSNVMLVQSAAAVLATNGTPQDLPILQKRLSENPQHTQTALNKAIKSLKKISSPEQQ